MMRFCEIILCLLDCFIIKRNVKKYILLLSKHVKSRGTLSLIHI